MYKKIPQENWLQKGVRIADEGLKIYGTARGLYEVGSALATGIRGAYQVASPMLATML